MRVLVTGGAGFIGSQITALMRASCIDVTGLDALHPAAHSEPNLPDGVLLGDIRDPNVVATALRGVDVVVHQAAMVGMGVDLNDLPEYVSCNDLGTAVLLAAMARADVRRLVLASSMVVYGEGAYRCAAHGRVRPTARRPESLRAGQFEPECIHCGRPADSEPVDEDALLDPRSGYAATKLAQEHLAAAWARSTGGTGVVLRYHNVYGPGMPRDTPYSGVAAIFRSALERGEPPRVFEDGGQRRDFVHVTDVARANLRATSVVMNGAVQGGTCRAYNIASGEPHTVRDMACALADAFGGPEPVVTGDFRPGDVRHIVASPSRAAVELAFVASVPFAEGMLAFAKDPLRV